MVFGKQAMALANYLLYFFLFLFLFFTLVLVLDPADSVCHNSFECGKLGELEFPLSTEPNCGLFMLSNCSSEHPTIQFGDGGNWYQILQILSTNRLLVRDPVLQTRLSIRYCASFTNESLLHQSSPSASLAIISPFTVFSCANQSDSAEIERRLGNYSSYECDFFTVYYRDPSTTTDTELESSFPPPDCSVIELPRNPMAGSSSGDLFNLLSSEFIVEWNVTENCSECHQSGGLCATNNMNQFQCRVVRGKKNRLLWSGVGTTAGILIIGMAVCMWHRKKKLKEIEEDYLDHVPGMPTRFSYQQLKIATNTFANKLGEGGFGSVFDGFLNDGTRIAVKCLDGIGHMIKKSFEAEVESIGLIHHVNLVKLIGFCAEKSHRLLVYEYMCNGSLDKWIYCRSHKTFIIDWSSRRKIIIHIAKGLAYLHEECRQKIIHLDIKPQNILLDENYNAKIADFGLSKLIDRDQSQVVTNMRGTPGYMAPEWLSSVITEKVDVYSFGVVVLEILCGRKNFDQSKPEEERHLVSLFKKKGEEGRLLDLIEDVECNGAEMEEMMQIGTWCLQSDYAKRPSMSMVIKVLEGVPDVEIDFDYSNLLIPHNLIRENRGRQDVTPLLPSVLSAPR